jgi:hypothetical protein
MKSNEDGNKCVDVVCEDGQIGHKDGTCEKCDEFEAPDSTKRNCAQPRCEEAEIVTKEGTCQACPDSQLPDPAKRECLVQNNCDDYMTADDQG